MECPLCLHARCNLRRSLDSAEIILQWQKQAQIDIRDELNTISSIDFYECPQCFLGFFKPDSACGSPALYEQLEKLETYYLPRKWEHDVALQDMEGATNGLEIGCGFGAFVARVIAEKRIQFEGCDPNPSAVLVAQASGAPVRLSTLEGITGSQGDGYDVICAFQVLEHVANPRTFLARACTLLRPGGKLLLGLPNAASFVKYGFNIYQYPPHHLSSWAPAVLLRLPQHFPLKTVRILREPLQAHQVEWYIAAYESLLRRCGLGFLIHPWLRTRIIRRLRASRLRRLLTGEAIYACYEVC